LNDNLKKTPKRDPPPFVTHLKSSEGTNYKIGDTLDHDGATFHYCDCPLHRNKLKWHSHHPDQYRIRNRWLKEKVFPPTTSVVNDATARITEENQAYNTSNSQDYDASSTTSTPPLTQDVQVLLANAMNLVTDNDVAKDFICDAINACNNI